VHDVPREPVAPRLHRLLREGSRHRRDVVRLAHDHRVEGIRRGTEAIKIGRPGDLRPQVRQPGEVEQGVGLHRVSVGHLVPVPGGEPGLQRHDARGRLGRGGPAGERQHALDVPDVGGTLVGVLLLAVVRLVRQAQAGLFEVHHVAARVTVVGVDERHDETEDAGASEGARRRHHLVRGRDGRGTRQVLRERLRTESLHGILVHEARVEVPDLGRHGAALRVTGGDLLDDLANVLLSGLAQLVERAVATAVGGNRRRTDPRPVDVGEQVVLRAHVRVDGGRVDSGSHGAGSSGSGKAPIESHGADTVRSRPQGRANRGEEEPVSG
jgi:hypothetical protein